MARMIFAFATDQLSKVTNVIGTLIMRRVGVLLLCLIGALAVPSLCAGDAAIEAQEGDVEHWIEYYKKERGTLEEPADPARDIPQSEVQDAEQQVNGASPATAKRPRPGN